MRETPAESAQLCLRYTAAFAALSQLAVGLLQVSYSPGRLHRKGGLASTALISCSNHQCVPKVMVHVGQESRKAGLGVLSCEDAPQMCLSALCGWVSVHDSVCVTLSLKLGSSDLALFIFRTCSWRRLAIPTGVHTVVPRTVHA